MKLNPQGMVNVTVLKPFELWLPGMVCGFFPQRAKDLVGQGFVELVDPEDPEPEPVAPDGAADDELVTIPDGWRDSHHMVVINLAKAILGVGKDQSVTRDEAIVVIETEIARRAAASTSEGEPK